MLQLKIARMEILLLENVNSLEYAVSFYVDVLSSPVFGYKFESIGFHD